MKALNKNTPSYKVYSVQDIADGNVAFHYFKDKQSALEYVESNSNCVYTGIVYKPNYKSTIIR